MKAVEDSGGVGAEVEAGEEDVGVAEEEVARQRIKK